jgi:hypothetical protein
MSTKQKIIILVVGSSKSHNIESRIDQIKNSLDVDIEVLGEDFNSQRSQINPHIGYAIDTVIHDVSKISLKTSVKKSKYQKREFHRRFF